MKKVCWLGAVISSSFIAGMGAGAGAFGTLSLPLFDGLLYGAMAVLLISFFGYGWLNRKQIAEQQERGHILAQLDQQAMEHRQHHERRTAQEARQKIRRQYNEKRGRR